MRAPCALCDECGAIQRQRLTAQTGQLRRQIQPPCQPLREFTRRNQRIQMLFALPVQTLRPDIETACGLRKAAAEYALAIQLSSQVFVQLAEFWRVDLPVQTITRFAKSTGRIELVRAERQLEHAAPHALLCQIELRIAGQGLTTIAAIRNIDSQCSTQLWLQLPLGAERGIKHG